MSLVRSAEPPATPVGPRMRWWGWGDDRHQVELPPAAEKLLEDELGPPRAEPRPAPRLDDVRLPETTLTEEARRDLTEAVGEAAVRDARVERVSHAAGKGYADLVRMRQVDARSAPDAIVYPASEDEVARVLALCSEHGVAVIPFGGGTSVVGGVEPLRDGLAAAISLDLARIDRLVAVDHRSLTAVLGAGLTGPRAEAWLAAQGLTLGHFPQSWEFATIGGFVATRSAGQASTGYGRIDELVRGVRCVSPAGGLTTKALPASAAGPALRELIVGSEGILGVITEATLAVRPAPAERRYEGWSFRSFGEGVEAFREMEQHDASPDVARLSDEEETRLSMAMASTGSTTERVGRAYLRVRGHEGGCIAIVGWEGEPEEVGRRRSRTRRALAAGGGLSLGERPGRAWERGRYAGPYLRDALLDRGVMTETLETATTWSNLSALHERVGQALRAALRDRGTPPLVMCHVSHLYRSGASLYYTFLARQEEGAELEQWRAAKTAATEAIVTGGGTITHHHAVGRDHAPWMEAEVGRLGIEVLRSAKERLDPAGIMNPGKLLPGAASGPLEGRPPA